MPGVEDLIITIGVSGQDDVIKAFGQIGRGAEEAAKEIVSSFGHAGQALAGFGAAAVGIGVGMGVWARHASEVASGLSNLAAQAGTSVESISALQSAMAAMGGSADSLGAAFRRMSQTVQNEWRQIVRESRDSRDKQIGDAIAVGQAQNNLFQAQEKHRQAMEKLGVPTGPGPTEYEKRNQAIMAADLDLQQSQLSARQAQKKADEDRLNDINNVAKAIGTVVRGESTLEEASKKANLEVGNVIKGLVVNAADPNIQARLANFTGGFNELATAGPKVKEVLYTFADFMKNAKDPTLEQAAAVRLFGRSLDQNMLAALRQGSEALKANEREAEKFGLVYSGPMVEGAEEFHRAYNKLTSDLSTTVNQVGMTFAPSFTEGMKSFNDFFRENHQQILTWASALAEKATPIVKQFFEALKGLSAELAHMKLDPQTDAGKWQTAFKPIIDTLRTTRDEFYGIIEAAKKVESYFDNAPDFVRVAMGLGPKPAAGAEPAAGAAPATEGAAGTATVTATDKNTSATQENTGALKEAVTVLRPRVQPGGGPGVAGQPGQIATEYKRSPIETLKPGETYETSRGMMGPSRFIAAPAAGGVALPPGAVENPFFRPPPRATVPDILAAADERRQEAPGALIPPTEPSIADKVIEAGTSFAQSVINAGKEFAQSVTKPPGTTAEGKQAEIGMGQGGILMDLLRTYNQMHAFGGGTAFRGEAGPTPAERGVLGIPGAQPPIEGTAIGNLAEMIGQAIQSVISNRGGGEAGAGLPAPGMEAIQELGQLKPAADEAVQGVQETNTVIGALNAALGALATYIEQVARAAAQEGGGSAGEVRASGGIVTGPGGPRSDGIPIRVSNREYVMQAAATNYYGEGFMGAINNMLLPRFSFGGLVEAMSSALTPGYARGGMISVAAGATSSGRPLNLYIGGEKISGLTATENAANSIVRAATSRAVRSGGVKASWYRG